MMTYFILGFIAGGLFAIIFMTVLQATKKDGDER